ncbi:MAG: alpha-2-macroglobulin family protein, partial [Victivallaceae bacterium]
KFFGKYSPNWEIMSIYDELFPGMVLDITGAIGGGDNLAGTMAKYKIANQLKFIPTVISLPVTQLDHNGKAQFKVKLPEFTGALQIIAIANNAQGVGSTQSEIILKRDMSITVNAPDFLTPQDECEVNLTIFNHANLSGEATYKISLPENIEPSVGELSGKFAIDKRENNLNLRFAPFKQPGVIPITLTVSANGKEFTAKHEITVSDNALLGTQNHISVVAPQSEQEIIAQVGEIIPSDNQIKLSCYTLPVPEMRNALDILNNYPYGCLEQITAKAFPYLAIRPLVDLGAAPEEFGATAQTVIRQTINEITRRSTSNYHYSMWPDGEGYWLDGSLFAAHFLAEALNNNFKLSEQAIHYLRYSLNNTINGVGNSVFQRAYAMYIASLLPEASYNYQEFTELKNDFTAILLVAAHLNFNTGLYSKDDLSKLLAAKAYNNSPQPNSTLDSATRRLGMTLYIAGKIIPDDPALKVM